MPSQFSEYVAYVNPGPTFLYAFSVALSVKDREATPLELSAFREVLESLVAIKTRQ
jgi:hypothetical protein